MFREMKPQEIQDNPFELIGKGVAAGSSKQRRQKQRHDGELGSGR